MADFMVLFCVLVPVFKRKDQNGQSAVDVCVCNTKLLPLPCECKYLHCFMKWNAWFQNFECGSLRSLNCNCFFDPTDIQVLWHLTISWLHAFPGIDKFLRIIELFTALSLSFLVLPPLHSYKFMGFFLVVVFFAHVCVCS